MRINKDNVVGAIIMLLIAAMLVWGFFVTNKLNKVALAHDNLVAVLAPVINQIQQANAQMQAARNRPPEPAPVAAPAAAPVSVAPKTK